MKSPKQVLDEFKLDYKAYESAYKDLHKNPGLSRNEQHASKVTFEHLKKLGYKVFNIGGYGIVGVLSNGSGKTVLARADMDALPIKEETELDYASSVQEKDSEGRTRPVMHACGHDMHVACLMAAADTIVQCKAEWSGTFIALFQPAEEAGSGADDMLKDGLYDKVPIPDVVLAQHVMPLPAGKIYTPHGAVLTTADVLEITIYGKGAHSSQPNAAVNAAIIAAHAAIRISNIKGTELSGAQFGTISVTAIEAGHAPNVIPQQAKLKVDIRTKDEQVRNHIIDAVKRVVKAECVASNAPKEPTFDTPVHMPLLKNDKDTTKTISAAFSKHFGENHSDSPPQFMASEDVSYLASHINKPICYWFTGSTDPQVYKDSDGKPPFNHSSTFAPAIQPTLTTGHKALVVGALTMLK